MRKAKRFVGIVSLGLLLGMAAMPVSAINYMDAKLTASFHWVPILKDSATGWTYYGTNEYYKTAEAYVKVSIFDGSEKKTATCTRYGWDAVCGEGSDGTCEATAKIRSADKAKGVHKGKKNQNAQNWTEVRYSTINK
ncbi:hypothetical protein [uncultured Eubacterium sp.]|uniref:hypothetical protein n=1 Tax=uncultured Eubacterium sp. TaxID=165185 RepID=UPI00259ADED8|nr:hypothetical protein [uncultured Eubacterium sp.]